MSRADVAVLVLDAADGLTAQDEHVAGYALDEGIGLVVAINKWDLVEKDEDTFDEYVAEIRREAPFLDVAPIVAISAKTGQRVGRVLEAALEIAAERRRRIPTAGAQRLAARGDLAPAAADRPRQAPRFFYATQAAIEPPTFVLFANGAAARSTSATGATSRTGCARRSGSPARRSASCIRERRASDRSAAVRRQRRPRKGGKAHSGPRRRKGAKAGHSATPQAAARNASRRRKQR